MNWKFPGRGGVTLGTNLIENQSQGIISNEAYFLFKKSGMIVGIQNRYYHM